MTKGQTENCSEHGRINIIGIETMNLIAGRLEICDGSSWQAVYDNNWEITAAMLVCNQTKFPLNGKPYPKTADIIEGSIIGTAYCRNSCFGASNLTSGFTDYDCTGESTLIECQTTTNYSQQPDSNAGVICSKCNSVHTTL